MPSARLLDLLIHVLCPLLLGALCYPSGAQVLPSFLKSYAADFLWAYAFAASLWWVWEGRVPRPWLLTAALTALAFEGAQFAGLLAGTGDLYDLLAYLGGGGTALLVTRRIRKRMSKTQALI